MSKSVRADKLRETIKLAKTQLRSMEIQERTAQRKLRTRQAVILGASLLDAATAHRAFAADVRLENGAPGASAIGIVRSLKERLRRPQDRAAFDLGPTGVANDPETHA